LTAQRLFVHAIVLVMVLGLTAYGAKRSGVVETLRLGVGNASSFATAQGGTVGSVELARQGTIVKPASIPNAAPVPHRPIDYQVGPGEDVKAVAVKFKIAPDDVCGSNPRLATDPTLKPGDALALPPVPGIVVTVGADETAQKLSVGYQVGLETILDYNYLRDPAEVRAALRLVLPGGRGLRCGTGVRASAPLRPGAPLRASAPPRPMISGPAGCPVRGAIVTQPFGPSTFEGFHTGIDLAAPMGTPIYAVAAGPATVSFGGTGYGNHVVITVSTSRIDLYGHMSEIDVGPGQQVQAGQLIGRVGSTGFSTGPHLHFEVRIGGLAVNPAPILRC
jgi:murein DD-endopeptidase MepM/ murein hydrolase activator NlpD